MWGSHHRLRRHANSVHDNRFELALGWFGDYDGYDITALNLLSQGPPVSRRIPRGRIVSWPTCSSASY